MLYSKSSLLLTFHSNFLSAPAIILKAHFQIQLDLIVDMSGNLFITTVTKQQQQQWLDSSIPEASLIICLTFAQHGIPPPEPVTYMHRLWTEIAG